MVFGMRNTDNLHFKIGENDISICKEFKYVGVTFPQFRSLYKSIKLNVEKAKKSYAPFIQENKQSIYTNRFPSSVIQSYHTPNFTLWM